MRRLSWRSLAWAACAGAGMVMGSGTAQAQLLFHGRSSCAPCCPVIEVPTPTTTVPPTTPPPVMGEPAQPPAAAIPPSDFTPDMGGMTLSTIDSSVGYIDSAIPSNVFRLRYDASYNANRATRAEFLYARGAPGGPGLPLPELKDDFQEISAYLEGKLGANFSAFIEAPLRFINPEINDNHTGFGDMNFGFKAALVNECNCVASFQLRAYMPTGDPHLGLGNDHVSLEPALLVFHKASDVLRVEGELRYWIPLSGAGFEGSIVRYGIGFSYGARPADRLWISPVVELVGWTVVDGKESITPPLAPPTLVQDAAGDTIVNLKLGLRTGLGDRGDFYIGYGRALTGEVWYTDIIRTELRIAF